MKTTDPLELLAGAPKRAAQGAAWSARFTLVVTDAAGRTTPVAEVASTSDLEDKLWGATRCDVRWRHGGRQRVATFHLPRQRGEVKTFVDLLATAILTNGPADDRGRPTDFVAAPVTRRVVVTTPEPRDDEPRGVIVPIRPLAAFASSSGAPLVPSAAPRSWSELAPEIATLRTVDDLVAWRMTDLVETVSRRGRRRSAGTLGDYESELELARTFFRYREGDPRLERLDGEGPRDVRHPGDSMLIDHPAGLTTQDMLAFVEHRKHLNLRVRLANENALERWTKEIERGERRAARTGESFEMPPAPPQRPETASVRTVAATCRTIRSMFNDAHDEGRIAANPWTGLVNKRIARPAKTHFSRRLVPSEGQVAVIVENLKRVQRRSVIVDGRAQMVDGERYEVFVETSFETFARPEEIRAIRTSWLHLDDDAPFIEFEGAEVEYPLRYSGERTSLVFVDLKARGEGETRFVPISRTLANRLKQHLATFVPTPDPTSSDPDERDPYVFTRHSGASVDPSLFATDWMRPAIAIGIEEGRLPAHFALLQTRILRHAGITRLLLDGEAVDDVADWAGNTPEVVRNHYRGVIDQVASSRRRPMRTKGLDDLEPGLQP